MKPSRLLLIDDDVLYCSALQSEGKRNGFDIVFFHNLQEGLNELISSRRIRAVILDGRCFIEPGQKDRAMSNFVFLAMKKINEIEDDYNRIIPLCVNTEHPADFTEDLEGIIPVFQKNKQHDELFEWLRIAISQLPEDIIRKRYDDVFDKINPLFSDEEEDLLVDILQSLGTSDTTVIITNLAILRRLLERLFDVYCIEKLKKLPGDFTIGHGSRTRKIIDFMHNKYLPGELYVTANILYKTCSKYGNHSDLNIKSDSFIPDKYSYQRLVNSYMELINFIL